jgi:methylthioribose-1-phosphate isomerase
MIPTVEWVDGKVAMIDQTLLPHELVVLQLASYLEVANAIRVMQVRGAPAIGVTAALGMALAAQACPPDADGPELDRRLDEAAAELRTTRPTAVNLFWAIDRMLAVAAQSRRLSTAERRQSVIDAAKAMVEEDVKLNRRLGFNGADLVPDGATILTHCNAGALACAGYGTALGVVRGAVRQGKYIRVVADETRPRLQGARLTCWELQQDGIPVTLIPDNAAGSLMRRNRIDLVVVGADRIAANGDVANKIGTYSVAVLAKEHGIPFYVAAPISTIDLSLATGDAIPIEERDPSEVTMIGTERIAPEGVRALNYAFDITPAEYVSAIITERSVAWPDFKASLPRVVASTGWLP